ncbi:hypothetical protein B0H19DRAFT_1079107 [Mycena capillaripes]|nr:hypothetical protein B0H19DRAFT_1079107 [Mycena capillaripes]
MGAPVQAAPTQLLPEPAPEPEPTAHETGRGRNAPPKQLGKTRTRAHARAHTQTSCIWTVHGRVPARAQEFRAFWFRVGRKLNQNLKKRVADLQLQLITARPKPGRSVVSITTPGAAPPRAAVPVLHAWPPTGQACSGTHGTIAPVMRKAQDELFHGARLRGTACTDHTRNLHARRALRPIPAHISQRQTPLGARTPYPGAQSASASHAHAHAHAHAPVFSTQKREKQSKKSHSPFSSQRSSLFPANVQET